MYGIDDEMMVIGFCFSCDDIAMLPLHDLRNSSTMPCHDHIVPNMHCFGCCQYSPCDVSINAHEETPIVYSDILGDFVVHGIPSHLCSQELVSSTLGIERLTSIREYLHKTKTKGNVVNILHVMFPLILMRRPP